mgnify:CR=1 FL=1
MNIIITNESNKLKLLNKLNNNKIFNNNKFITFKELKKKLFFDYDDNTLEYIMTKYNVNINIAKIYLDNMYFLKEIDNDKVIFLNKLKKELDENNLLIYNPLFKKYILNQEITIYAKDILTKEEKLILNNLNYKIEYNPTYGFKPYVYEATSIKEELEYIVIEIKKLLKKGIDINNIKLIASKEYYKHLEYYFKLFKVPINIENSASFLSLSISKEFLNLYDYKDIDEVIDYLSSKYSNVNELIAIINKSVQVKDKIVRKEFIKRDLKQAKVSNVVYKNAIELHSLEEVYSKNDYVFLLGFNIGSYPKVKKDDDFLSDNIKTKLGLDTSLEINRINKDNIIKLISNIPNLTISYSMHGDNGALYPSSLIEDLGLEVKKIDIDKKVSYSRKYSELEYAMDLDNLYKYNDESKYLKVYQNNLNIPYREYNNKFTSINNSLLKERLEEGVTLSYTSLETFNECSFRYYLSKVLNLDVFEETFKTIIGQIVHHILEIGINKEINIEKEISLFIKELDFEFKERELFYIHVLAKEIDFLLKYLKEQKKVSSLNDYLFETELNVEKDYDGVKVNFKGFIDKVMTTKYNDKEVIAVVDYKTGDKSVKLDTLEYGLNMQLPIYLYLLKTSDRFKDSIIAGFYIERVLNNVLNRDKVKSLETLKKDNLRLSGYTNSNETIMSLLDSNYKDSKMIKGLRFKKDGSFYSTSKVLSNEEMDNLIIKVNEIIDDVIKYIVEGNFKINPKVLGGKNIACTYCKFKDICFKTKDDEVLLEDDTNEVVWLCFEI